MNKPASAPDVMPVHETPPQPDDKKDGTNETLHHPDDQAERHPARDDHKPRGPFVTGNW